MKLANSGNKCYTSSPDSFRRSRSSASGNSIRRQGVECTGSVCICIMAVVCDEYGVKYALWDVCMHHFVVIGSLNRSAFTAVISYTFVPRNALGYTSSCAPFNPQLFPRSISQTVYGVVPVALPHGEQMYHTDSSYTVLSCAWMALFYSWWWSWWCTMI